jgi:SAM-dependent methyltransferase
VDDREQLQEQLAGLLARPGAGRTRLLNRVARRLGLAPDARPDAIDTTVAALLAELGSAQAQTTRGLTEVREWLAATSASGDELRGRVGWLGEEVEQLGRRVPADIPIGMLHPTRFTLEDGQTVAGFRQGDLTESDDLYLEFENIFRGSEEDIAERQRAYLSTLAGHAPVLDVGCGRGELLELLRASGVQAHGVDLDSGMVNRCLEKGLAVELGDGVAAVRHASPGSLGAVVAAQVIEHLPYSELVAFLRALRTALAPGGITILETVNPHAPQALKQFWIDPTHQHPLFPEVVLALLQFSGFAEAYIWFPLGSGDFERDHGEQPDYVIVATTAVIPR